MAYLLKHAARPDRIAEREWAVGQKIKFGTFTSCIGVVARITGCDKVIGIHLSLTDASGQSITESDVNQIIALLHEWRYDAESAHIIGATFTWGDEQSCGASARAAYIKLTEVWEYPLPHERNLDDGILAVSVVDGRMTFTYTHSNDGTVETFDFPEQQQEVGSALDPLAAALAAPLAPAIWHPRLRSRSV